MFVSLDRVDLVGSFPHVGGPVVVSVLTDHRSEHELFEAPALSTFLAVARCLFAAREAQRHDYAPHQIAYTFDSQPPAFLTYAVEAAGGVVVGNASDAVTLPIRASRDAEVAALLDDATRRLAASYWVEADVERTLMGLYAIEGHSFRIEKSDEVGYFLEVVRLATLAASLLEGGWVVGQGPTALVWRTNAGHEIDLFALSMRYVEGVAGGYGPSHDCARLLQVPPPIERLQCAFDEELLPPATLERIAFAGRADDAPAKARAEALVRIAVERLAAWGITVGPTITWISAPGYELDASRSVAPALRAQLESIHAGRDGFRALFDRYAKLGEALDRAANRAKVGVLERWLADLTFRSLSAYRLRVPEGAPAFAGRSLHELPNPYEPILQVYATGFVVEDMNESGTRLAVVEPTEEPR